MNASLFLICAAYLLGAIPVGLIISKIKGVDIRKVGSGNIGATNVFRSVGKTWGILTFIGDAAKGFLPTCFFPGLAEKWFNQTASIRLGLLCGCAAIVGHNWPIFLRFKGGKGVATSAGVLLGIAPASMGIGLATWILFFLTTRYVSVASISAAFAVPVSSWFLYFTNGYFLPTALSILGALAIWRHSSNIRRLLNGSEHRFAFGKKRRIIHRGGAEETENNEERKR